MGQKAKQAERTVSTGVGAITALFWLFKMR